MRRLDAEDTGLTGQGAGWWTAWQFDNAVTYFGGYVESKLAELDSNGRQKYTLDYLLADEKEQRRRGIAALISAFGVLPDGKTG